MKKPTLYLETTIPSYLTAKPSRDIVIAARQQLTSEWWQKKRQGYALRISQQVLSEIARGDSDAARLRLLAVSGIPSLEITKQVQSLATRLASVLQLPKRAAADAVHLAIAVHHRLDYLLTWNCAHLANAHAWKRLARYAARDDLALPTICTPQELLE